MSDAVITLPMLGENFSIGIKNYFTLFGHSFYWYGVIITIGFLVAVIYMSRRSRSFGLTNDNVVDIFLWAIPLGIIFARLYYVIFEMSSFKSFLDILKIWNGGLAIYGGIIGGMLGIFIYSRIKKIPLGVLLDISALGVMIGQIIGRWGNFINREAYGPETSLPWKMGLTLNGSTIYVHPTFLYESLWNLLGFLIIHFWTKKSRKFDGQVFLMYAAWYGFGRFFIESLRVDSLYLFGSGVRVSQLLAALSFLAALILLIIILRKKPAPEKMYVNSVKAADEAAAHGGEDASDEIGVVEDDFDGGSDDEDDDGWEVVEPAADDRDDDSE